MGIESNLYFVNLFNNLFEMVKSQVKKSLAKKVTKNVIAKKMGKKNESEAVIVKSAGSIVFKADARKTIILEKIGRESASNAIRASKALGLPITYMERGLVIQELPDGVKIIISPLIPSKIETPEILLKKGMILHAKK